MTLVADCLSRAPSITNTVLARYTLFPFHSVRVGSIPTLYLTIAEIELRAEQSLTCYMPSVTQNSSGYIYLIDKRRKIVLRDVEQDGRLHKESHQSSFRLGTRSGY